MCLLGRLLLLYSLTITTACSAEQSVKHVVNHVYPVAWNYEAQNIIVKASENWQSLAARLQIPASILQRANNLKASQNLIAGQEIHIPARLLYQVSNGETAIGVAIKHGISFSELIQLNDLQEPYHLHIGQQVKVLNLATKPLIVAKKSVLKISNEKFIWPIQGKIIAKFGTQANDIINDGLNIEGILYAKVLATAAGTVVYAGNEVGSYGNLVIIQHAKDFFSSYGHLAEFIVQKGDIVHVGQVIGYIGKSGEVEIPQLHFGFRKGKTPVNPMKYLPKIISEKRK